MAFVKRLLQRHPYARLDAEKCAEPERTTSHSAMDRALQPPPAWRRWSPYLLIGLAVIGGTAWLLHGPGISTYRVPANELTIATVTRGKFVDYIAVRATVAPLATHYLTTEQGGIVTRVLAQDGTAVKAGQTPIVLANAALRLQKVDLHFQSPSPPGITVGQAIDTRLQLGGARAALLLPNRPFYQDTGGTWALVLAPNGTYATRRRIELGQRNPDYVEVLYGLLPGEKVIIWIPDRPARAAHPAPRGKKSNGEWHAFNEATHQGLSHDGGRNDRSAQRQSRRRSG